MKYEIKWTTRFKKDYKMMIKQGVDIQLLDDVITKLALGEDLPSKHKDHSLIGNYANARECHIKPNWLLIYRVYKDILVLALVRTGSHQKLFSNNI